MTREEAMAFGKRVVNLGLNDETHKFAEMAIKALEQEPCENCISRQSVIDVIKSLSNANPSYWNKCDVVDREYLIDEIADLPSVTPQPKEQWKQLKETITEIKENNEFEKEDVTLMCQFLLNYMGVLEKAESEE